MECQKIANFLSSVSNKPCKFRTRNWAEINDDIREAYSSNEHIRFKTAMPRSSLCDCSDAHILVKKIYQLIIMQLTVLLQIIEAKK